MSSAVFRALQHRQLCVCGGGSTCKDRKRVEKRFASAQTHCRNLFNL